MMQALLRIEYQVEDTSKGLQIGNNLQNLFSIPNYGNSRNSNNPEPQLIKNEPIHIVVWSMPELYKLCLDSSKKITNARCSHKLFVATCLTKGPLKH